MDNVPFGLYNSLCQFSFFGNIAQEIIKVFLFKKFCYNTASAGCSSLEFFFFFFGGAWAGFLLKFWILKFWKKNHGPPRPDSAFSGSWFATKDNDKAQADPLGLNLIYSTPEPDADIIFVHGLGGGSYKTWSWEHNPENFWPIWLSTEPELSNTRIFTFGYNADFRGPAEIWTTLLKTYYLECSLS